MALKRTLHLPRRACRKSNFAVRSSFRPYRAHPGDLTPTVVAAPGPSHHQFFHPLLPPSAPSAFNLSDASSSRRNVDIPE